MYQQVELPLRRHQLQLVQTVLLIYSVIAGLILKDFEGEVLQAGLPGFSLLELQLMATAWIHTGQLRNTHKQSG